MTIHATLTVTRGDATIQLDITGRYYNPPNPSVGIFSESFGEVTATDPQGNPVALSEAEEELAQAALCEARNSEPF